jgi:hypothetical protein
LITFFNLSKSLRLIVVFQFTVGGGQILVFRAPRGAGPGATPITTLAGTGKSTIARTVARRYYDEQRLAASFFFSCGGGDIGHAGKLMTSIAVQLAENISTCR